MSPAGRRALTESLVVLLRSPKPNGLGFPPNECALAAFGRPTVNAGKWFYGIHGNAVQRTARSSYVERFTITITQSVRVTEPDDRVSELLIDAPGGITDRLAELSAFLTQHQYVWARKAGQILGPQVNGFIHPNFEIVESEQREVRPDHWRSPSPGRDANLVTQPATAGIVTTLTLSGIEREQYIESAT